MKCKICSHLDRLEIDRMLVSGGNCAQVAKRFDLPYNSLYNHANNHITRQLAQAVEKRSLIENNALLQQVEDILGKGQSILDRCYEQGKDATALRAIDSIRGVIDMLSKISYQLNQSKLAQLELEQKRSGDDNKELTEQYVKDLAVLTTRELKLLQRIQLKLRKQDFSMRIIPDEAPAKARYQDIIDFDADLPADINTPEVIKDDTSKPRIKRGRYHDQSENVQETASEDAESEQEPDPEDEQPLYTIKPIVPTQIHVTPWSESELNPRRRRH